MKRRSLTRLLAGVAGLLALLVGWLILGPAQIGGTTSYAVIVGNSMEPALHRGDLAVVRRHSSYRPGDVVLYDSADLGAKVLHRIVRIERGHYVFKGDNNDFADSERPTEAQLVGELAVNVPGFGRVTEWVRRPFHAALIVGLASLLALGGGAGLGVAGRRGRRGSPRPRARPSSIAAGASGDPRPFVLAIGAALLLFAVLAFAAFTRPETRLETVEEAYVQQGKLDYSARVPRSPAYPDGLVSTGEPIFLKLVSRLRFAFDYRLESQMPVDASGRIGLEARLTDGRGWERLLPLARERPFSGARASVAGTIDLTRVQTLIDQLRDLTGTSQGVYSLTVLPRVTVDGTAGSDPVDASFAPSLAFELGDLRLQPQLERSGDGVSPFAPREAGKGTRLVADDVSVGAVSLQVKAARRLSLIGLLASALLGGLGLGSLLRRRRGDEPARIEARYGHLLLPVASHPDGWPRITELPDIESLVRLAEHHERMILHLVDGGDSYVVEEGGNAYRYRAGSGQPAVRILDPPVPRDELGPERELDDTLAGALIPGGAGRRYGR